MNMNFTVTFSGGNHYAVDLAGQDVGLYHLDTARGELGSQISEVGRVLPFRENVVLTLTEEQARASGQFDQVSRITVTVPQAALNRFVEIAYRASSRGQKCAEAYYCVDKALLLTVWKQAGYPLTWHLS
jgi:hypothetical protein